MSRTAKVLSITTIVLVLLAGGAFLYYNALKSSRDHLAVIPATTSMVVQVDHKELFQKAGGFSFTETPLGKYFTKELESNEKLKEFYEKYASLFGHGLNIFAKSYMFSNMDKKSPAIGFTFAVKDKDKVTQCITDIFEDILSTDSEIIKHHETYSSIELSQYNSKVLWDDRALVITSTINSGATPIDDETILNKQNNPSIVEVKSFQEMLHQKGDINIWIDNGAVLANDSIAQQIPAPFLKYIKDLQTTYSISFEQGKIVCKSTLPQSEKISILVPNDIIKKHDQDFVKTLPAENPFAYILYSINFDAVLKAAANATEEFGYGEQWKTICQQKVPMTMSSVEDAIKSFGGDFAIIISKPSHKSTLYPSYVPDVSIAFSLKDAALLEELVKMGEMIFKNEFTRDGNSFTYSKNGVSVNGAIENNVFYLSSSDAQREHFLKQDFPKEHAITDHKTFRSSHKGTSGYLNLNLDDYPDELTAHIKEIVNKSNIDIYDDINIFDYATIGNEGVYTSVGELHFKNKADNSLKHITTHISEVVNNKVMK